MTTVADPSLAWSRGPARPGPGPGLWCCEFDYVIVAEITGPCETLFGAPTRSWSIRFQPEIIDAAVDRRPGLLRPYPAGIFGTGTVAFDREFLIGADGFDELIGAGTGTRGDEDLDIFGDRPAGAAR